MTWPAVRSPICSQGGNRSYLETKAGKVAWAAADLERAAAMITGAAGGTHSTPGKIR
ncbi:hypothetical protein [Streptomyces inhibens]|uniref:hypothetical protein n=1 Tax=Streptomyces inhibens TaxID=2293571 RepID=UPI0015F28583|nr:hypothetical protein [Streptomyces inhibens]